MFALKFGILHRGRARRAAWDHAERLQFLLAQILGAALLTTALYLCFLALPYPLASLYSLPLLDLGKLTGNAPAGALAFAVCFGGAFAAYLWAYRVARRLTGRRALLVVIGAALVFSFLL